MKQEYRCPTKDLRQNQLALRASLEAPSKIVQRSMISLDEVVKHQQVKPRQRSQPKEAKAFVTYGPVLCRAGGTRAQSPQGSEGFCHCNAAIRAEPARAAQSPQGSEGFSHASRRSG